MKVLQIRPNVMSKTDGINTYCFALKNLFNGDDDIEILPIENYSGKNTKLFNCVFDIKRFYKTIKETNPDVIHINGYLSFCVCQAFWVAKLLRKRIIYTAHWHPYRNIRRPFAGKCFFNVFLKYIVKSWSDYIITLNNEDTAYFQSFCSGNIKQIPHWSHYKPEDKLEKRIENAILFVGRLNDSNKGIEHLYQLPVGRYQIHLVGSGNVELREDMVRHTDISNEELFSLYRKASVVVVPSKYEAFSYVALEALMSGTPVLMTENVRIADYLTNVSGVGFFRYGDYSDFNRKIQEMMLEIVDKDAIERVFDISIIRNKYKSIYMGVSLS